jgi:hypothetical protein
MQRKRLIVREGEENTEDDNIEVQPTEKPYRRGEKKSKKSKKNKQTER